MAPRRPSSRMNPGPIGLELSFDAGLAPPIRFWEETNDAAGAGRHEREASLRPETLSIFSSASATNSEIDSSKSPFFFSTLGFPGDLVIEEEA